MSCRNRCRTKGNNMSTIAKYYDEDAVIQAVKDIFEVARFARGCEIKISVAKDKVPTITYSIIDAPIIE